MATTPLDLFRQILGAVTGSWGSTEKISDQEKLLKIPTKPKLIHPNSSYFLLFQFSLSNFRS